MSMDIGGKGGGGIGVATRAAVGDGGGDEELAVLRIAGIATLFGGDGSRAREVAPELASFGLPEGAVFAARGWDATEVRMPSLREPREDRGEAWARFTGTAAPEDALGYLIAALGSERERESAAAAAVLWRFGDDLFAPGSPWPGAPREWIEGWMTAFGFRLRPLAGRVRLSPWDTEDGPVPWDGDEWRQTFAQGIRVDAGTPGRELTVTALAGARLERAMLSPDSQTRELALAALIPAPGDYEDVPAAGPASTKADPVSVLVHGTWGWKGGWWRPKSSFHSYVLTHYRTDLYSRGTKYSWSGAYSRKQRAQAALDFGEWAADVAPKGLHSVFAHSYGAEVVALAMSDGTTVEDFVLLSAPVTAHVVAGASGAKHVIDVRVPFDKVLAIARAHQRLRGEWAAKRMPEHRNLTEVLLDHRGLGHGSTHEPDVWDDYDVAARGGL
jgi:hypothetical protein